MHQHSMAGTTAGLTPHFVAEAGRTHFTSDGHLRHARIIELAGRPFWTEHGDGEPVMDVDEMTEQLILRWNRVVRPEDTVFYLGDAVLGQISESLPLISQLNGTIHLCLGNHDRPWSGNGKRANGWAERYLEAGFSSLFEQGTIELRPGLTAKMCHFPYSGDSHGEDRYVEHRPVDDGSWLLNGHVHQQWQIRGRQINVGVDQWDFTPVALETIVDLIDRSAT